MPCLKDTALQSLGAMIRMNLGLALAAAFAVSAAAETVQSG
jgi:hypothetical protein